MSPIFVCPLSSLNETLKTTGARWLVSLSGPGKPVPEGGSIITSHLKLCFNDIAEPREALIEPNRDHISQLLSFGRSWAGDGPLLVHCWMGISRSTAACLILAAQTNPNGDMIQLAQSLRKKSPMATPNSLMIKLADDALNLDGRLIEAVSQIGRGADASEGLPFFMEVDA